MFPNVKPEGEEEEPVEISEQAKDLANKVVGITVRCGASLVFAAIGAGICSCLIRPSTGQWIGKLASAVFWNRADNFDRIFTLWNIDAYGFH